MDEKKAKCFRDFVYDMEVSLDGGEVALTNVLGHAVKVCGNALCKFQLY